MICAGFSSYLALGLEDGHVSSGFYGICTPWGWLLLLTPVLNKEDRGDVKYEKKAGRDRAEVVGPGSRIQAMGLTWRIS